MEWRGRWVRVPDLELPTEDVNQHPKVGIFINRAWQQALLDLVQHADQQNAWESTDLDRIEQNAYTLFEIIHKARGMIGAIIPYATTSNPPGTLPCDGSEYNAADYPLLYAALDSRYQFPAGLFHPEATFLTPDFRGRFIFAASDTIAAFDQAGESEHTLTADEMPAHTHTYQQVQFNVDLEAPGAPDIFGAGTPLVPISTSSAGGDAAHNNMPPYIALNYAIVCY